MASKKRVFEVTDRYSVRYFLIRQGERWLVDEVQILSSKRLEGKGSPSPFERPEGIAPGQRARPTS